MSNKYYYLVASLPYLTLEGAMPFRREEFLSECKKWLTPADLNRLEAAGIKSTEQEEGAPVLLAEWRRFDMVLRTELAGFRRNRKKDENYPAPAPLKDIFGEDNPLSMEIALEKKRWDFIEECEFGRHFDLNFLMLYFLKLQILERLTGFDKEKGKEAFEQMCEVRYE